MSGTSVPPALQGVDHIHVYVADRAAAERWYRDVMGLTRVPSLAAWATDGGPLTLQDAADTVHIALFERPPQPEDHAVAWSIYFEDPDGNPYEITTYEYAEVRERLQGQTE